MLASPGLTAPTPCSTRTATTGEFGYRFLVDKARETGEPMAERTTWKICSQQGWWSAFADERSKNGSKPGPPVHDDLCAVTDRHGAIRHEFRAQAPSRLWLANVSPHAGGSPSEQWTGEGRLYLCDQGRLLEPDRRLFDLLTDEVPAGCRSAEQRGLSPSASRRRCCRLCLPAPTAGPSWRSREFVHAIDRHHMVGSMGRPGEAGDNATMKSWFAVPLKNVPDRRAGPPVRSYGARSSPGREDLPPPSQAVSLSGSRPVEYELIMTTIATQAGRTATGTCLCSSPENPQPDKVRPRPSAGRHPNAARGLRLAVNAMRSGSLCRSAPASRQRGRTVVSIGWSVRVFGVKDSFGGHTEHVPSRCRSPFYMRIRGTMA